MLRFRPRGLFYRCARVSAEGEAALTLSVIEPPTRNFGTPFFDENRLMEIFRAFASDTPLPPIEVFVRPDRRYRYRVRDGLHRFYASAAVGYACIPIAITHPPLEFETNPIPSSKG